MGDPLRGAHVRLREVVGEAELGQRRPRLPVVQAGVVRGHDEAPPVALRPVVRVRVRPVTAVLGVGHHRRAQAAAPLELDRVAVRVVADRQAGAGAKAGVERERDGRRPAHGRAIAAQARLAVRAHGEEAPALLDRTGAVGERLLARLPRLRPPPRSGGSRSTGGTRRSRAGEARVARTRAAGRGGTRRRRRAGTSRRPACGRRA